MNGIHDLLIVYIILMLMSLNSYCYVPSYIPAQLNTTINWLMSPMIMTDLNLVNVKPIQA